MYTDTVRNVKIIMNNKHPFKQKFTPLSSDKKIDLLYEIIQIEQGKPENESDTDVILECTEYINELRSAEEPLTAKPSKKLQSLLDQIATQDLISNSQKSSASNKRKTFLRSKKVKLVLVLAAVLTLLFSSLALASHISDDGPAWQLLSSILPEAFDWEIGRTYNEGSVTIIKENDSVIYDSMEELIKAEGWDLMYPSVLPQGILLREISVLEKSGKGTHISYTYSSPVLFVAITEYFDFDLEQFSDKPKYEANGVCYTIFQFDTSVQAIAHVDNLEYSILYKGSYDELLVILDGMKGIDL